VTIQYLKNGISRRAVLGGAAAGVLAFTPGWSGQTNIDVVIVGAGAAGIGAAITLHKAGLNCRIVEAQNYVGGRALTDTTTFQDGAGKPVPFDIGCAWIHRFQPCDPFADYSKEYNFTTREHDLDVSRLYYGSKATPELVTQQHEDEEEIKEKIAEDYEQNRDVAANTLYPDWPPPRDAAATYMGAMDMAVDFKDMSTSDFHVMADYEPNRLVREGYGSLVRTVATRHKLQVHKNCEVTAVESRKDGVLVTTSQGTITAKAAIVTVSTGVLQTGRIKFTPEFDDRRKKAIEDVPMGLLVKIPLSVPNLNDFLNGVRPRIGPYDNVLQENTKDEDIYFLAQPWDSNLMVGFVGGDFARELCGQGEAEAIAFATDRLGDIFGTDMRRRVTKGLMTNWLTNEHVLGAYSAARPGRHAARDGLARPLGFDNVLFAGEAMAPEGMFATCSGAYLSGRDVAARLARKLRTPKAA